MMTVPTYDERPSEQSRDQETSSPKWTVLVYQAGDNNLSEECVYALKEMKKVGTEVLMRGEGEADPLLNVVVQFDPSGHGNPTRRFKIRAPGGDGTLEHDELKRKRKPETDTGDAETLLDFLCESIEENPTTYYMVVLAGHGAGIREGFFLQDDERPLSSIPNSFPIPMLKEVFHSDRLKKALGADRKINILGLDACAMSMVEVCYELRGTKTLELLAASEGFSLNAGWPFDRIIEHIRDNPNIGPDDLAEFIVKQYVRYYHDYFLGGASVDQSIIVLEKVEDLKQSIDHLANTLIDEFEKESPKPDEGYDEKGKPFQDAILLAHWAAQSYNGEQCIDLYDFCTLLQKRYPPKESDGEKSVWFACERVKKILGDPASQTINSKLSPSDYSVGLLGRTPTGAFESVDDYQFRLLK